jgi:tRNA pseudouridine38-40 synthase
MQIYKIVVAYDGTDFCGWQVQPEVVTVASTLQRVFKGVFKEEIAVTGASRTDTGVHALGQVAKFYSSLDIDLTRMRDAWNSSLPKSILVRSIEKTNADFHIFGDVIHKTYYYHLFYKRPLPFIAKYGWLWKFIDRVDFHLFEKALHCFIGEHDFRSFCKVDEVGCNTVRRINFIKIRKLEKFAAVQIEINGNGFLQYQIRRMLGAALDVSSKKNLSTEFLVEQLKYPCDQQELTKAESCGLCLRKIFYKKDR